MRKQWSFISICKNLEVCSTLYSFQGTLKVAGYSPHVSNWIFRQTLGKTVVWIESWASPVYVEFSVPEAMSPFAWLGSLSLCGLRASPGSDSHLPAVPLGRVSCRLFLPWLNLCAGQLAGSLYHSEKSGRLLFLIPPSCTPERGGPGVCWQQASPGLWRGHSSGPWLLSPPDNYCVGFMSLCN